MRCSISLYEGRVEKMDQSNVFFTTFTTLKVSSNINWCNIDSQVYVERIAGRISRLLVNR